MKPELLHLLDRCRKQFTGFQAVHLAGDPGAPVRVLTTSRIYNFEGLDHLQAWAYGREAELEREPVITSERIPGQVQTDAVGLIIATVGKAFGVDESEIRSASRTAKVARARQVCMVLARELLDLTYPAAGDAFSRDHGTVLHAVKAVAAICETEPGTHKLIEDLRGILKNELEHLTPAAK